MRNYFIVILSVLFLLVGCAATHPNRSPQGEMFPKVLGQSLAKEQITIPDDFKGSTTLLLIGYVQDSQFDIDRWLIGLDMTQTQVPVYEIPTIDGMLPRMFKTTIDNGMRKGIPKSLWRGVVTVYDDAEKIVSLTGNENPNNARVLLLGGDGKIRYFYDQGFAVDALKQLKQELANVNN